MVGVKEEGTETVSWNRAEDLRPTGWLLWLEHFPMSQQFH